MENHVRVNHAASILTAIPLPVPEQGFLCLGEGLNFVGVTVTIREFTGKHSDIDRDSIMEKMEDAICHENEELFLNPSAEYGRYVIYQINEKAVKDNYQFMNLKLVEAEGIEVRGRTIHWSMAEGCQKIPLWKCCMRNLISTTRKASGGIRFL